MRIRVAKARELMSSTPCHPCCLCYLQNLSGLLRWCVGRSARSFQTMVHQVRSLAVFVFVCCSSRTTATTVRLRDFPAACVVLARRVYLVAVDPRDVRLSGRRRHELRVGHQEHVRERRAKVRAINFCNHVT